MPHHYAYRKRFLYISVSKLVCASVCCCLLSYLFLTFLPIQTVLTLSTLHLFSSSFSYSCIQIRRTYLCPICVAEFCNWGVELINIWHSINQQRPRSVEKSCICLAGTAETFSKLVFYLHHPSCMSSICTVYYHKVSSDGWLLDPVEGTLGWGASLEIKNGLHYAAALFWVAGSHHEEFLIWVVVLGFLFAICVIYGRGLRGGVETFIVAGVNNVVWVRWLLEC